MHVVGWGLYAYYVQDFPTLAGLGLVAYALGLRHAFDADHIAAIDDTTRLMLSKASMPMGIGFFFSMGHSTIVFALAVMVVAAAALVNHQLPAWQDVGSIIGAGVSGVFLLFVGTLNLFVLRGIVKAWRRAGRGAHSSVDFGQALRQRSLIGRMLGGRLRRVITRSWQMYPLGLLFGLSFDTASEIAVLAMTAGAATGGLPAAAVLSLPVLFAAGMSAVDTTDGVLMVKVYRWALVEPSRQILYNVAITGISIAIALCIGTIQIVQVAYRSLDVELGALEPVAGMALEFLGYIVVAVFIALWIASRSWVGYAHRRVRAAGDIASTGSTAPRGPRRPGGAE